MKKIKSRKKYILLIIVIALCLSCVLYVKWRSTKADKKTDFIGKGKFINRTKNINETEDSIEKINLINEGKLLYNIVYPSNASVNNKGAAEMINNHIKNNGIESNITNSCDGTGEKCEILVGNTENFPKEALNGIDMTKFGSVDFVIKHYGNKIIIAVNNDQAFIGAANYFNAKFLDIKGGKTSIPKDYCYVSNNVLYLYKLKLGGVDITEFALSCDAGLEEPLSYIKELIKNKCGKELTTKGKHKIVLTTNGSVDGMVSAKFENRDLVIRAKDLASMKKAIVCFWYENIAYLQDCCDIPNNLEYSRDLNKTVFYSDFGLTSSDNQCCLEKLYEIHTNANKNGHKVFADYGANYYIGVGERTIDIATDVEWGNASFTIDDSGINANNPGGWIFYLGEEKNAYSINTIKKLSRDMKNVGVTFPSKSIVTFEDNTNMQYIRYGANADSGLTKRDTVVVDENGNIDMDAALMWDFDNISSITVQPVTEKKLTISGGTFTTIANRATGTDYYTRGINVRRSNTEVNGIKHYITGESESCAPYEGFIRIDDCAYTTVKNCVFTGHLAPDGTYDVSMRDTVSVSFVNCTQANDITNDEYWGVCGTNYCKNMVYDGCILSRFDAHRGVTNATIKNSIIGHGAAATIGYGTLLIENSTFTQAVIVNLREDYGSSWEGDVIIRNCSIVPISAPWNDIRIINGRNEGNHNFGYDCYMPANVSIDGLYVAPEKNDNVYVFGDFGSDCSSGYNSSKYPYYATEKVNAKNVVIQNSEKKIQLSKNRNLFAKTKLILE